MCVFQQPMLFNRAPRFLFVATNAVSEEGCCTQIRIKYSFWLSPLLFFFLQSILEKLISSNFAIYFSTQSFSTPFERWKITSLLRFRSVDSWKTDDILWCAFSPTNQSFRRDTSSRVSGNVYSSNIKKEREWIRRGEKKKMKRSLAWIFKRLERKSNKIVFRFVKVNKVKWMDPSPFALFPPPLFFRNGEKENSENIIISRNRKFRFDYRALLPECVLFIYVGAKDCGHKKCVCVRRGEFFRVIM